MAITIELYKKMCAYFDGKLTLEEEKEFLELVENDPELKKEFEWEEEMIFNSVPKHKDELLLASDAGIHDVEIPEFISTPASSAILRSIFTRKFAIAASLFIAIGILAVFIMRWSNLKIQIEKNLVINDSNFNNKNIPDTGFIDTSKEQFIIAALKINKEQVNKLGRHIPDLQVESPLLGEVQVAYVKKQYAGTIKLTDQFTQLRGSETDKANIKAFAAFYKAIAFIELNNDSAAIKILSGIIENEKQFPDLVLEAKWNICKAYYKIGKNEAALKLLMPLLSNSGFLFKVDGEKLLQMLKTK